MTAQARAATRGNWLHRRWQATGLGDLGLGDLASNTIAWIERVEDELQNPTRRALAAFGGITLVWGIHAGTGDGGYAWLAALPALLGGLVAGVRFGAVTAAIAAIGHAWIDGALGFADTASAGIVVRSIALMALALTGAVIRQLEVDKEQALLRAATEDSVTGLLNVRAFYDGLARLGDDGEPYSILVADISGMRGLNERYGHPTGTEAVRCLGHILRRSTKRRDLVGRLGSDELAIALVGADSDGAEAAAARLSALLAEETIHLPDGQTFQVHAHYGVATYPRHATDEVTLLRVADRAVAAAKRIGQDVVSIAPVPSPI